MTRIFISHSHLDEEIADLLIDFLSESIEISKKEIRCTSDPNHGLDFSSSSISDQLKNDLKNAGALIVIATIDSLRSPWILFEVGSFWTTDKLVAPIVGPGLTIEDLPGPLKGYRSIRIEDKDVSYQLNELINQLSRKLNLKQSGVTRRRDKKLEAFISNFRDWKSQLPVLDVSQQESIEDLIQKVEEIETKSGQEKKELEQNYQNQKEKLEQSLSKIKQLERQLRQERSQKSQLEEKNTTSQKEKEQLANYLQTQIRDLEQQLTEERSQAAKRLEDQERSQINQLQEMKVASQTEKEELEQNIQLYQSQIKKLEQQLEQARPLSSATVAVELKSEKGIDYTRLRDLLAAGNWQEADQETAKVMLKAAGKQSTEYLSEEDLDNFPCEDLRTINQLWLSYSGGKFGFSVQKKIYESLGGTKKYSYVVFDRFCDRVGWRKRVGWRIEKNWVSYSDLFDMTLKEAKQGYLPTLPHYRELYVHQVLQGYNGSTKYSRYTLFHLLSREDL